MSSVSFAADYSHGVQYSPTTVISSAKYNADNLEEIRKEGVAFIRLQWVDFTNVVRYRVIPLSYFIKMLRSPRPSIAIAKVAFGLVSLSIAPAFSAMGEYLLIPDLSSLKISSYDEGHATVLGWFEEKAPVLGPDGESSVKVDLCPRTMLQRVVEDAKTKAGVEFLVGFETEFILLKSTNPVVAVNNHSWTASNGLPSGSVESRVLREIAESLEKSGIELTMYHAEAAPGQYEIVTGPLLPLEAADALVHTRETIVNIAAKHGLRATFAPRVYMDSAGSGAHAHVSVHSASPDSSPKPTNSLSTFENAFLASVLSHIPALMALTLPTPASYQRVADGVWSGGTYVCWGTENREAPIRLTNSSSPSSRNFELRFLDGTCNPYLALAGILGVGSKGVREGFPLEIQDCPGPLSAAQLSEEERKRLGITQRVSLSWEEARDKFSQDSAMKEIFGANMVDKYLSVNKTLGEALQQDSDEQLEAALTRLVEFF